MGLGKRAASFPCLALGSHSILQLESRGLKIGRHTGSQTWVAVRTWRGGGWWSHRSLVLSTEGSNPAIGGGGMKIRISKKFSSETWSHTMLSCYAWIHEGPERGTDLQRLLPHREQQPPCLRKRKRSLETPFYTPACRRRREAKEAWGSSEMGLVVWYCNEVSEARISSLASGIWQDVSVNLKTYLGLTSKLSSNFEILWSMKLALWIPIIVKFPHCYLTKPESIMTCEL